MTDKSWAKLDAWVAQAKRKGLDPQDIKLYVRDESEPAETPGQPGNQESA